MRVLLVNKFYDPRGGAERVLFDLEDGLRERGHEVAVFAGRDPRNRPSRFEAWFTRGRDYADRTVTGRLSNAISSVYDRGARRDFARLIDHFRPEIVHLHNIYHQLSPSILDEIRDRGLPALMTLHDYKLVCPVYRLFRDGRPCQECLGRRIAWGAGRHRCSRGSRAESWWLSLESTVHRLRRSYERSIALFLCPSRFMASKMAEGGLPAERLVYLPNAVRRFPPPAEPGLRSPRPTVLFAGRMSEEKGVDLLLEAARAVPEVQLRLAGTGPAEGAWRARSAGMDQVSWLGRLEAAELEAERARAWVEAVPSRWWENAPLSVIEALARGRPALVADHGGLRELIEDGVEGWRVAPGDIEAWSDAFRRVAASAPLLARMGENARARAQRDHDPAVFLDRHEALYRRLIEAPASSPAVPNARLQRGR